MSRSTGLLIVGLTAVLAVTAPWPGALAGNDPVGLPGDPSDMAVAADSDVYDCVWHFWWTRRALSSGTDPIFSPVVFYPRGASLSLHNIGWTSALIYGATGIPGSPVAALNLSLFLGTLLTFAAGTLLAREWGAGAEGALLAGMIMALMPSRIAHLYQHYMIAQIGWTLLSLFFVTRHLRRGKGAVPAGLMAAVATLESFYHSVFLILGFFVILILSGRKTDRRRAAVSGISVVAGVLLGLTWFIPRHQPPPVDHFTWREAVHWSAEPRSYLLPSPFGLAGRLFGFSMKQPWMPNAFEGQVSPGLTVLLVLAGVSLFRRRRSLALVSLGIAVLSFGPLLKWNGVPTPLPLPWMLPARVPLLAHARVPARLAILFGSMAAVTTGVVFGRLRGTFRWVLLALIVFELAVTELPTVSARVPESCLQARGPVLDLPGGTMMRVTSFYQTLHGSPRLTSFLARGGSASLEEAGLSGLLMTDSVPVTEEMLLATPAGTVFYHRMLLPGPERHFRDSLYRAVFPGGSPEDSVWVWQR